MLNPTMWSAMAFDARNRALVRSFALTTFVALAWGCGGAMPVEPVPPPPPPPPPAAAASAPAPIQRAPCVKDTECKGNRVCEDGHCVAPH